MEGILKAAPTSTQVKTETKTPEIGISTPKLAQEFYDYFHLKTSDRNNEQFKTVVEWSRRGGRTIGESLLELSRLENRLGAVNGGETRLGKMYNYVRTTKNIEDRKSLLKNDIDGIKSKHKAFLKHLDETYQDKVSKINQELERISREYNIERTRYAQTASKRSEEARKEYSDQIAELKRIRDAYKGGK